MTDTTFELKRSSDQRIASALKAGTSAGGQMTPLDFIAGFFVIALGVVLGAFAALFIGLYTGWIQFC